MAIFQMTCACGTNKESVMCRRTWDKKRIDEKLKEVRIRLIKHCIKCQLEAAKARRERVGTPTETMKKVAEGPPVEKKEEKKD